MYQENNREIAKLKNASVKLCGIDEHIWETIGVKKSISDIMVLKGCINDILENKRTYLWNYGELRNESMKLCVIREPFEKLYRSRTNICKIRRSEGHNLKNIEKNNVSVNLQMLNANKSTHVFIIFENFGSLAFLSQIQCTFQTILRYKNL